MNWKRNQDLRKCRRKMSDPRYRYAHVLEIVRQLKHMGLGKELGYAVNRFQTL
jgi:hypothetical protein